MEYLDNVGASVSYDMRGVESEFDDAVAAITGVQETKGMEPLFRLGEVGSGVTLGFNDYSLLSFGVLR